jgi:hypothetical protein
MNFDEKNHHASPELHCMAPSNIPALPHSSSIIFVILHVFLTTESCFQHCAAHSKVCVIFLFLKTKWCFFLGTQADAVEMALPDAVPGERRKTNTGRVLLTCASAVGLAIIAICFLATKGTGIEHAEASFENRMQQLHEQASQSHLRSKAFLLLQGKRLMISLAHSNSKPHKLKNVFFLFSTLSHTHHHALVAGSNPTWQGTHVGEADGR